MTPLVAWFRLRYAVHRLLHASCEKAAIQNYHAGYVRGAQDERSLIRNATLEQQLRQIIADSERPAA